MSGALKHVFDRKFVKIGGSLNGSGGASTGAVGGKPRLYGLIVNGRHDSTSAVRPVAGIVGALSWRLGGEILESMGDVTDEHFEEAEYLGATLAIQLMDG